MRRFVFILVIILVPSLTMAQASGGQIRRPNRQSYNVYSRTSSEPEKTHATKTYTVEEQYEMGRSFFEKENYKEAIKWYKKAAEVGNTDALRELGFIYLNGKGTAVDKTEAVKWLSRAGNKGDAMAQEALGTMYKYGDGVKKNEFISQKWFKEASPKIYNIAKMMMKSNNQQCLYYFQRVLNMEILPYNVWAMFHIGAMFYYGEGGYSADYSRSCIYFKMAADKGNRPAMYYLGMCYELGRGVSRNLQKSKAYYKQSGYDIAPSRDF